MSLEVFVLPNKGGLYPRRIIVYLAEKKINSLSSLTITSINRGSKHPRKCPGSVPQLRHAKGPAENLYIMESIPILNYLEDLCDAIQLEPESPATTSVAIADQLDLEVIRKQAARSMRGETAEERARIHEITILADEATEHFKNATHAGCIMYASAFPKRNGDYAACEAALSSCRNCLLQLNDFYKDDPRMSESIEATDDGELDGRITIGDCVLFILLQFAKCFHGKDLSRGMEGLVKFYSVMEGRPSTKLQENTFSPHLTMLAHQWVRESNTLLGRTLYKSRVVWLHLVAVLMALGLRVKKIFG